MAEAEPFRLTPPSALAGSREAAILARRLSRRAVSPVPRPGGKRRRPCLRPRPFPLPMDVRQITAHQRLTPARRLATAQVEAEQAAGTLNHLASLKPLGQLRDSFILASGEDGLWIIDQHVAHERVLFEKILRDRTVENVQRQRLLMPMLVELKPWQMVVFAQIADELDRNGFEVEPFGPQTLAVKAAPVGLEGAALERMLTEVIEQCSADAGAERNKSSRMRILRRCDRASPHPSPATRPSR